MDPSEFLKTAELLKSQTEQAHLRTSIGRSYYAVFLYFRERFRRLGLEKTKHPGRDEHAFVIQCLRFCGVTEGVKASQYLNDLQQVREDADYHLDRIFSQNDADDAFAKAKRVITDYEESVTPNKEKSLIDNALAHARLKDWI